MQPGANPGIVEPPVIVGEVVIVVTQVHDVRAFDPRTGAPRWRADVSFAAREWASEGLACEGLVIVPTGDLAWPRWTR
jgi:glucose dehydrogenase